MKSFYKKLHGILENSNETFYTYYDSFYSYRDCYRTMCAINSMFPPSGKQRIVLYTSKHFETYCAIFAILLSGNTWIPLTPSQPAKRSLDMLKVAEPHMVVTDCPLPSPIVEYTRKRAIPVFNLHEIIETENRREFEPGDFHKDDIAYIMFTSGSTGVPKGVPMTHENYINFIENTMEILPFEEKEVFADYHDFAFDISIFYLFCCVLAQGSFVPIVKPEEKLFPIDNIVKNRVTVWSSVPTVISRLKTLRPHDTIETSINIMFLCGEPLKLDILKYCYENMGIKNVYNFYGLTETGVENFYHECQPEDCIRFEKKGFVPIGKPLKGNEIKITEEKELLLSGCQTTPGYLGGVGKEKFVNIDGARWYHTGDIVERYEDVYFCKGRLDSQVKISGYRVELMDIEVCIRQFPGIGDTVCFVHENMHRKTLVCALEASFNTDHRKLKDYLKENLPQYMIPSRYFALEKFPRNKNGKVDRKGIHLLFNKEAS